MQWKRARDDRRGRTSRRSHETRTSYGTSGSGCFWCTGNSIDCSMNWRDKDGNTNWWFQRDAAGTSCSECIEERLWLRTLKTESYWEKIRREVCCTLRTYNTCRTGASAPLQGPKAWIGLTEGDDVNTKRPHSLKEGRV